MKGSVNKGQHKSQHKSMNVKMDNPNVQKPIPSGEMNIVVRVGQAGKGKWHR